MRRSQKLLTSHNQEDVFCISTMCSYHRLLKVVVDVYVVHHTFVVRHHRMYSTTMKYRTHLKQCTYVLRNISKLQKNIQGEFTFYSFPNIRKKWKDENCPLSLGEQQILNVPQCGPLRYRNAFPIHDTLPSSREPSDGYRSTTDITSDRNIFC